MPQGKHVELLQAQLLQPVPGALCKRPRQLTAVATSRAPHHTMWRGCSAFRLTAWMPLAPAHSPAQESSPHLADITPSERATMKNLAHPRALGFSAKKP